MATSTFHETVIQSLAELKAGHAAIVDRLDKINGSVGRHDEQLASLMIEAARRQEGRKINAK